MLAATITKLGLLAAAVSASTSGETIYKDVVVVGGGASGCYAAVTLRDTYNKSVLLIEKEAILGGHVDSFTDPVTGTVIDYGVKTFLDAGNSSAFFDKMGVGRDVAPQVSTDTIYVDYLTGSPVDYHPPDIGAQIAALQPFLDAVQPYEPLMQPGYFAFPAEGADIPEDLLMPFSEFVDKYGFADALPFIYMTTGLGMGNMTGETTMFVLQSFGASMARSLLGLQDSYVPASLRNQDLYDAVGRHLGDADVMLDSRVVSTDRTVDDGVTLKVVSTGYEAGDVDDGDATQTTTTTTTTKKKKKKKNNKVTTIKAKRLLISIAPTLSNMSPFSLSPAERRTLAKFQYTREYTGIVDNAAFAPGTTYMNTSPAAAPNNTMLAYPALSHCARFDWMGVGNYFRVTVVGDEALDAKGARALCQEAFGRMLEEGVLGSGEEVVNADGDESLHWNAFSVHGDMHAHVTPEEVYDGFFGELYALQGGRSTFWTGGAWSVNFQTTLWQFDDLIMPAIVEGI